MDINYCCQRAEECLTRAQTAASREERLAWDVLAAAWVDVAEEAKRLQAGLNTGRQPPKLA